MINLTLPVGMTIVNASGLGITGSSETGKWEMKLDTPISATGGTVSGSLSFNVELDGNGSLPMNETFQASAGSLIDASITTHFTVKDKSNGGTDEWDYTKTYQSKDTISPITSTSRDEWGIIKSNIKLANNFTGNNTVEVQWKLEIGLKDGGGIATSANSYTVNGRTGGTFELTEDPVVLDREGKPVSPTSVTVRADFGSNQTYDFTTDKTQVITLDTCAGKEGLDDNLDSLTAPYYSTYTVTAVYPADAFIAGWNEENDDPLEVVNTATLIYSRSGETEKHQETANAKQDIGDETAPAALTISKEVQFYGEDGAVKPYSSADAAWDWGDVEGDAVFKIEVKNAGGTYAAAKLYTKNADGSYTLMTDSAEKAVSQVSINRETDDDGKVTVYVEPGDYKITEIDNPEHTTFEKVSGSGFTKVEDESAAEAALTADSTSEVTFTNTADYGRIVVTKKGTKAGADAPASELEGAVFGLYTDEEAENPVSDDTGAVTATVSNGTAVFNNVEAETYYIKEITAPAHYTADNTVHKVTVTAGAEAEIEVTNTYNGAYVKLQKMYQVYTEKDGTGSWSYAALTDGTLRSQPKFTLQKKVDNGWEDVKGFTNATLDADGVWAPGATVPVYEEGEGGSVTGTLITYRFKETLPLGWEGDKQEGNFAYSAEFNLGQALLGKDTTNVATGGYIHKEIMNNRQTATITLTKIFRNMGTDGVQTNQTADAGDNVATFQLYRQIGNGAIEPVDGRTAATDKDGQAVFTGLDVVSTGNQTISYYLEETNARPGYALKLAEDAGIDTTGSNRKTLIGPISFENDADLSVAVTAYNVEQKIPVKIIKKDSTDNNKEVSGAKFSVEVTYAADGTTEGPTTVASGAVMLLDATRGNITLEVTETKAPAGYEKVTTPKTEKITIPEGGVGLSQNVVAVDFENDPYPSVTIAKTVEGKAVSTDVVFDVYTKGTDGNFVKATYPGYTDGLTLTSGDTLRLPAGEYWLHEQVPEGNPNKILDPDQFFAQYSEKYPNTAIVQAVTKEIDGKNATFFGPFKVKDDDTTSVNWGSLDNISSVGGLTVTKQVYTGTDDNGTEQFAVKNGAEITISYKENGTDKTKKATTGTDGKATFSDLPVYNDDGSKISYTIEETKAPGNNKYDIAKETFETTLESGKTLTAEAKAGGKDLIFRNYPLRKLTVTKYVRDLWEYEFTGKQQLVQGAEIALYKLDEKGEKYTFVDSKTTGNIGQVTFDNLGEGTYVAVEVNCPEIDGQTAVPADEKELLSGKPESFAASDLEKYNYVKLEGREDVAGELINEIGWTQIKAEKVSSEIKEGEDEPRN